MTTEIHSTDIAHFLEHLAEAPRRIAVATKGLPEPRLTLRTQEEPWSVNDILAHLRASADVREKFIHIMLTQDRPTLRYISPRSYIRKTNYLDLAFYESFQSYNKQRNELLKRLGGLSIRDWSRSAIIKEHTETVFSHTRYLTEHESAHCEQIEKLVK
jgi:DinB family protein